MYFQFQLKAPAQEKKIHPKFLKSVSIISDNLTMMITLLDNLMYFNIYYSTLRLTRCCSGTQKRLSYPKRRVI